MGILIPFLEADVNGTLKKIQWNARYLSAKYIVNFAYSRGDLVGVGDGD